jgi:4'-phosphopantetheinyl transferase
VEIKLKTAVSYLIQSSQAHPALAQANPPRGWLSRCERAKFDSLKSGKRRRDWLLGRWTAKQLLQETIQQRTGRKLSLDEIEIGNDADGVPIVNCGLSVVNCEWALSISHSQGWALCAVREGRGAIGADMERIEPRRSGFAAAYFTDAEQERIMLHVSRFTYDALVTAVWSAKEAVLKALQLGLRVDTRAVTCLLELPDDSANGAAADGWRPFTIHLDAQRLPRTPDLQGWWRLADGFALTIAQ